MCQQATVDVQPRTAATRHPAGRQTPRRPRLLRSRPPPLAAGLFLLAGTILKMGQNARFGSRRTIAFMWSCALLLCETHPAGRLRAARAPLRSCQPRAPRRAGFFLLSGIVLKKRVLQWGCASKPLWTCSRALLPRDTQPAGRPRATRASSAVARPCFLQDSFCCPEPH